LKREFCFAALLLATGASPVAANDAQDAAKVAAGFYQIHQQSSQDGIPDAKQRAKYAPYISPELEKLLIDADLADTRFAKANTDSPPMIEGDLFSPNFEGITSFQLGACTPKGASMQCRMELHFAAAHPRPQDKPVDWTDTMTLVKAPEGWRIDDIAYGGNWDFGNHDTLKAVLKDVIAEAGP
jgi:hypothetical protein